MDKVITVNQVTSLVKKLHNQNTSIVLAGGVFDVLHPGHIQFFSEAKKHGNILMLLLESDEAVRKYKGRNRPIFSQQERAKMLEELADVDVILLLQGVLSDADYYRLTSSIKPDIIAATKDDPSQSKKQEQAKLYGAQYIEVIDRVGNHSSSDIIKKLGL